jgi:excisionase family DNA binding protein
MARVAGVRRLTVTEAAERLGKRPRTVYDVIARGRLAGFKVGRRIYTTDAACDEYVAYLAWRPPRTEAEAAAAGGPAALEAAAGSREAREVVAQLRELEARVHGLPPAAALLVLRQCLRHASEAAALFAALAAAFLWTQQVADAPMELSRLLPGLPA